MKIFCLAVLLYCADASAGILTGAFSPVEAGSNVNLTAAGKLDWVHWGLYTDTSVDRKSVAPLISNFSLLGDSNSFLSAYQYSDNSNSYSWFDGTPVEVVTNTTTGVWAYGFPTGLGSGFQLSVPADTSEKTLQVFVGAYRGKGKFIAELSDGSAASFTNANNETVDNLGNGPGGVFTINFAADSSNQTLTVTWTLALTHGSDANVTLQAATLTAPGADNPPAISITNPVSSAAFAEPATILLQARAQDFDGTITNVAFYSGTNELGEVSASPYDFNWTGVPRGHYSVTAVGTDDAGVSSTSQPVEIFVYGSGGSESGSVAASPTTIDLTSEGAADWAHWGLITNTSFDFKESVPRQISNFTALGTNIVQQYSDNFTAFSWSDGTPTPGATNSTTGVFIAGQANGFQITVPADATPRQLKLYVGGYGVQAEVQAWLDDFSAPPFTDTSISNMFNNSYAVYTINYAAADPGRQLVVVYRALNSFDPTYGNVTLQSATLQGGAVAPLPVRLANPAMLGSDFIFSFQTQSNLNYVIEFADALPATNWATVTVVPGTGGEVTVTNQDVAPGQRYYRVQVQ